MDEATTTSDFFSKQKITARSNLKHLAKVKIYIRRRILNGVKSVNFHTNYHPWYGNTLLHASVSDPKCRPEAVLELMEWECRTDVNAKNDVGDTPLHFAAYYNCRVDVIKILLEHGADIHASNHFLDTALHRALDRPVVNTEVVKILLEYGAKVNKRNSRGEAALHYCLHKADMELVRLLLDHGAYWRAFNNHGDTLLHRALDTEYNLELIQLLIDSGIPIDSQNVDEDTPLQMSLRNQVCRPDIIKLLLDNGANSNLQNYDSEFPLHTALKNVACCTPEVVQLLLYYGARVNASDHKENSILHMACISYHCSVDIIRLLLDNGAHINALNKFGETPLHSALLCLNCRFEVIELLLENGASLDTVSLRNGTPLHVAVSRSYCDIEIVKLMLDHGADVNLKSIFRRSALFAALKNPKVNIRLIKLLLGKQALVDTIDERSNTPLHYALQNPKCPVKVIKLLLENNAKLNKTNWDRDTPMHCALRWGNLKIVRLLLAHRGLVTLRDENRRYPLEYAIEKYNKKRDGDSLELVKLLIQHSYLEKSNFKMNRLIRKCWDCPLIAKFNIYCREEMRRMPLQYVTKGLTLSGLISGRFKPLAAKGKDMNWDIKHLLGILLQNKYPVYNEVIATTIKREVMLDKLKDNFVYTVNKFTGVKTVLNYHSACHITSYLSIRDLLNLLLAFHKSCRTPCVVLRKKSKCKPKASDDKIQKSDLSHQGRECRKLSGPRYSYCFRYDLYYGGCG